MTLFNIQIPKIAIPKIKVPIRLIAIILAIIGAALFYWTTTDLIPGIESETAKLEKQITTLTKTEKNLTSIQQNLSFYLNETKNLNEETDKILSVFPAFMHLEDKILYADELMTDNKQLGKFNVSRITYGASTHKMSIPDSTNTSQTLDLYSIALNGAYSGIKYQQVKDLIDFGLNSDQRFVLNNISINFDEKTGTLSGQFGFNTYFVSGQKTQYEFPKDIIDNMGDENRVGNLFG